MTKKILQLLYNEKLYPAQIAKRLGVSRQRINYYIKQLERRGLIIKVSSYPALYILTPAGKKALIDLENVKDVNVKENVKKYSYRVRSRGKKREIKEDYEDFLPRKIRAYARVKIYIDPDTWRVIPDSWKVVMRKNWMAQYIKPPFDWEITPHLTTKSFILDFHQREFDFSPDFVVKYVNWIWNTVFYVCEWLRARGFRIIKVELVDSNFNTIHQELAFVLPKILDKALPKRIHERVTYPEKARGPTSAMAQREAAWIDRSYGEPELETNSLSYAHDYIMMPRNVKRILMDLREIGMMLASYHEVFDELTKNMRTITSIMSRFLPAREDTDFGYE